ncbi:MAG TPA: hypothetical protein VL069_15370, partial [Opitutus sp.]|nr:hypothetical protein [Opitutus sp.]
LRGVSQRLHVKDSPIVFFEIDEESSNVILRDPYFRFYLQWSLRPRFGLAPARDPRKQEV